MIRKLVVFIIVLLIFCGCSKTVKHENYNEVAKSNSLYHRIFECEDGIVLLHSNQDEKMNMLYHKTKEDTILKNEKTGIGFDVFVGDYTYYKDQWYYAGVEAKEENDVTLNLYKCNLDGSDKELLYKIDSIDLDKKEAFGAAEVVMHKDIAYVDAFTYLYIVSSKDVVKLENVLNYFIEDEILYILKTDYTLMQCDLKGENQKEIGNNMLVSFVDENFIFYKKSGEQYQQYLYILNRNTNEEISVEDTLNCYGVIKDKDLYVFETRKNGYKTIETNLMNKEGKIIDSKPHDDKAIIQLLKDNKIYVYNFDIKDQWYGYYPIKDNKIQDLVKLEISE